MRSICKRADLNVDAWTMDGINRENSLNHYNEHRTFAKENEPSSQSTSNHHHDILSLSMNYAHCSSLSESGVFVLEFAEYFQFVSSLSLCVLFTCE